MLAWVLGCAGGKGIEAAPQDRQRPRAALAGVDSTNGAPWRAPNAFDEDVHLFPVGERIGVIGRYESDSRPALALWDPRDGLWTELDGLPETRDDAGLAWLPDGTLVAAGGYNHDDPATTTLIRRPTGEWVAVATGEIGDAHAAALPDGRVLIVGGDEALLLDPTTLRRTPLPGARAPGYPSVGVAPDGLVLVGGSDRDGRPLTQVVRWDAAGPHALPDLPAPRYGASVAAASGGRIAVVGGHASNDAEGPEPTALLFDGATWSTVALSVAHGEAAATWLADGSLLVVGPDGAERVEPGRAGGGTVTSIAHTGASGAALTLADGRALVVGGWSDPHDAAIFDPELGRFRRGPPELPEWVGRLEDGAVVALGSRGDSLGSLFARLDPDGAWTELAPVPPDAWPAGLGAGAAWSSDGEGLLRYQPAEDRWSPVPAPPGDPLVGAGGVWTVQEGRFGRVSDGRTFTPPARWGSDPVVLADGALLLAPGVGGRDELVPALLLDGDGPRVVPGLADGEGALLALPDGGALWFRTDGASFALDAGRQRFVAVESPPVPPFDPDQQWSDPVVLADPPPRGAGALVLGVGRYEAGKWSAVAPRPVVVTRAVTREDGAVLLIGGGVWAWDPRADPTPAETQAPPTPELLARVRPPLGRGSPGTPTCGVRPAPPPLATPRGQVAAVRLGSRVLAIGGSADVRASEVVEGWDGDVALSPPALPDGLDEAAGAALSDGTVFVVGGGGATEGEAWLLSGDQWTAAPLPVAAQWPSVVALPAGGALVIGGASWHKPSMENAWRLEKGRWTAVPYGGQAVANPAAVGLGDGRVLVVGGRIPDWWGSGPDRYTAEARIYAGGRFTPTAPLAHPRAYATATRLPDGRVLVVGGIAADPDPPADADGMIRVMDTGSRARGLRSAEIWDPETGAWSAAADLAVGRWHHAAGVLPDGTVLVVGGVAGDAGGPALDAERYDPAADRWTPVTLRAPRKDAAVVEVEGGLWVIGGQDGSDEVGEIEAFGAGACSVARAPVARREPDLVPLGDGSLVLVGGRHGLDPVGAIERYAGGGWMLAGALPEGLDADGGVAARLADGTVLIVGDRASGRWDPRTGQVRRLDLGLRRPVVVPLASGALVLGSRADRPVALTFDPETDRFTPAPSPPEPPDLATLLADGRVLAGAGSVGWVWDPVGDPVGNSVGSGGWAPQQLGLAWSGDDTLDLLPDGRVLHVSAHGIEALERDGTWRSLGTRYARFKHRTVVAEDGRVALVGGLAAIGWESGDYVAEDVDPDAPLVVWDPRTGAFDKHETELGQWFDGAAARLEDGRLLLVGGRADPGVGAEELGVRIVPDPF